MSATTQAIDVLSSEERIAFLRDSELFLGVPEPLLARIESRLVELRVPADAVVFREGDSGDAVYLVIDGVLDLVLYGIRLLSRQRGECVGEFALIDDEPRSTSAVAATELRMLRWDRRDFQNTLADDPRVARGIFRVLTAKLREDVETKVQTKLQQERWRQDIARAREIQMGMLPASDLARPDIEMSGFCSPAAEVGGDYYDYLPLDDGRVGLVIGDVTGHGFYSGLLVAMAKSCIHTQLQIGASPPEMLAALRRTLDLSLSRQQLMTCCYVVFDPAARTLSYANAGHPYPYLRRAGASALEKLEALDPILGALDVGFEPFSCRELDWRPGDTLVLYSDGVTEARDARGTEFDHPRLESVVLAGGDEPASATKGRILESLRDHGGGTARGDDLTLVVARAL